MVKIRVDMKLCDFHGQCAIAAPEIFELTAPDELKYKSEVPESMRHLAEAAADLCPAQAIFLDEDD